MYYLSIVFLTECSQKKKKENLHLGILYLNGSHPLEMYKAKFQDVLDICAIPKLVILAN